MLAIHGNETEREIELEGCPETRLTNVTLIKSRSLPSGRKRRGSPYSNGIRRHHSRAFNLTFIIQGTVLCSPENAIVSCGAMHDAILIRAKMSLLVFPEFMILIMAPHELKLCLHVRRNSSTANRLSLQGPTRQQGIFTASLNKDTVRTTIV